MALLSDAHVALRISDSVTTYDTEINGLIAAAQSDLTAAGVDSAQATAATDPLIKQAILTYVKARFGSDNPDSEKLEAVYAGFLNRLSLIAERTNYTVTFTCSAQCEVTFDGITKWTNASGVVVFLSRAGTHLPYSVDGGTEVYIDVTGTTAVTVV